MAWEKGDLVHLKSGGPTMTVQEVTPLGVACSWFDRSKHQHAIFAAEALVKGEMAGVTFTIVGGPEPAKQE